MAMSGEVPQDVVKGLMSKIFDWLLCQKDVTQSEVQNQPSVSQAKKLRFQLLSILMQASPSDEIYDLESVSSWERVRGLNISLECMIERIEQIEA